MAVVYRQGGTRVSANRKPVYVMCSPGSGRQKRVIFQLCRSDSALAVQHPDGGVVQPALLWCMCVRVFVDVLDIRT